MSSLPNFQDKSSSDTVSLDSLQIYSVPGDGESESSSEYDKRELNEVEEEEVCVGDVCVVLVANAYYS